MTALTAEDLERAISWNLTIAAELLGKDARFEDEGKDRKWGPFRVCRQSGAWYDFAAATGGYSSIELIRFLKKRAGETWSFEDAERWLAKFLAANPGVGSLEAEDGEWTQTRQAATAERARHYLEVKEPLTEDCAEARYLHSRGLSGPYPAALGRVPNIRPGESALVMPLVANERVTGAMLTYIDALGAKSLAAPSRRRLDIERAPGAVMVIQESTPGLIDVSATMVIAEGLENALSIAHPEVAHPGWKIIGLPGISALKNLPAKGGDRLIVFQDSDPPDHPAQAGLQAGIDNLILQGGQVRRTEWSEHGDADAILQAKGPTELKRLLAKPAGAPLKFEGEKLSIYGEIARLALMSPEQYEAARKQVAKDREWRVAALDKAVARLRPAPTTEEEGSPATELSRPPDEPWVGAVPPLGTLLDTAYTFLRGHIWQPETGTAVAVVWAALTHLVHSPAVNLQVRPKLHITSALPDCGKTGLLEILAELSPRAELQASYTGSSIFRLVHAGKPTLFLDEADQVLADPKGALAEILNASHRRRSAYVIRSEQDERGQWHVRRFSVWCATAFAGIGQLPPTLASRSIRLELQRALPEQSAKLRHLEDGTSAELTDLRRQLAAWAETQGKLARPTLPPGFHNRLGDNWRPLLALAQLAGGEWAKRIEEAMEEARNMPQRPPLKVRLLAAIKEAFATISEPPFRLSTGALIGELLKDEEGGWDEVNKGKPINPAWLRERLEGLLDPPGSQRWKEGSSSGRDDVRGYVRNQFTDAFARYTQTGIPPDSTAPAAPARPEAENPAETAEVAASDEAPDGKAPDASSAPEELSESATRDGAVSAEAGGADESPDNTVHVSLLITQAQKGKLRDLGYGDEQIREMSPATAHRILGLDVGADDPFAWAKPAPPPSTADVASTPESPKVAENLDSETPKKARPTARSRRAKPNGSDPTTRSRPAPRLDMPEPSLIDHIEGSIAEEIRQLHAANPKRSLQWIAKQSGQPPSLVREILGDGRVP